MITPLHNQFLVRPDGDMSLEFKKETGVDIQNPFEYYNTLSIEGTVMEVPGQDPVWFGDDASLLREGQFTPISKEEMEIGLRENVDFEVRRGDRVLFHYRYLLEDREPYEKVGNFFSIHYSDLLARVDSNGELYPLNGQVLVVQRGDLPVWEVIAEGAQVRGYADGSIADTDAEWPKLVGKRVAMDRSSPVAIEGKFFSKLNVDNRRIHIIHRKHICGFY